MAKPTDIRAAATELFFLPVETRVPLKFGPETLTHVTCARARLTVRLGNGSTATRLGRDPAQRPVGLAKRPALRASPSGT